jgi:hypothetical protein
MMRHDPLPPKDVKLIGLLVQYPLLKLPQQFKSLRGIGGSALLLIEIVQDAVSIPGIVDGALVAAQELKKLKIRLIHEIARKVDAGLKISLPK